MKPVAIVSVINLSLATSALIEWLAVTIFFKG